MLREAECKMHELRQNMSTFGFYSTQLGLPGVRFWTGLFSFGATCPVENFSSNQTQIYRYIHMYTDPDPQILAPVWSLETGQECPVFSTCWPGNPKPSIFFRRSLQARPGPQMNLWGLCWKMSFTFLSEYIVGIETAKLHLSQDRVRVHGWKSRPVPFPGRMS